MAAPSNTLWQWAIDGDEAPGRRPTLDGDTSVDVCVVGGGFTGLWTAYYLLRRNPNLDVLVVEAESVGFGASGRNGGWCSALLPQGVDAMAAAHGRDAALAMRRAMIDSVFEVGAVVEREQIDCDYARGGTVVVARNAAQLARARDEVAHEAAWDGVDGLELLDADQTRERIGVAGALGATYTPYC